MNRAQAAGIQSLCAAATQSHGARNGALAPIELRGEFSSATAQHGHQCWELHTGLLNYSVIINMQTTLPADKQDAMGCRRSLCRCTPREGKN
jgi:hypothetical protein